MTRPKLRERIPLALRLAPMTVPQLRLMLGATDRATRNALDELASHRRVMVAGESRGRTGAPARVWRLLA